MSNLLLHVQATHPHAACPTETKFEFDRIGARILRCGSDRVNSGAPRSEKGSPDQPHQSAWQRGELAMPARP